MNNPENLVVIAAGGGNDVFSAIAYINAHVSTKSYKNIILFGILGLTPFHTNDQIKPNHINIEDPIIIPTSNMKRYIMMYEPKEIYANESILPEVIKNMCPLITHYACLSPKYSAFEQAQNIRNLFEELHLHKVNTIIEVVDFGGDILTNGEQSSIISPELDAFSLAIVRNLSEFKSRIVVCFPGVDGELDKSYLKNICESKSILSESIDIELWIKQLQILYFLISTKRPGNTIPNMLNVLDSLAKDNSNNYKCKCKCKISKSWTIGKNKYTIVIKADIDMNLQNKLYYFDINIDNPFVNVFNSNNYDLVLVLDNLLDIYSKQTVNEKTVQSSDMYLQYLRKDNNGLYTNRHLIFNSDPPEVNCISDQSIIFVNILPYPIVVGNDKINCFDSIKKLQTYNTLFVDSIIPFTDKYKNMQTHTQ